MNLEVLLARAQEIEGAIVTTTNQLTALHGHKTEVAHWLTELQKAAEAANSNQDETPVDSCEEVPVE